MTSPFTVRYLSGKKYLRAATELLLTASGQDPYGVIYEAGDIQWWWREDSWGDPTRQVFWCDTQGRSIALLLLHAEESEWVVDFFRLPDETRRFEEHILPDLLQRLERLARDAVVSITVDERAVLLLNGLRQLGFVTAGKAFRQMVHTAPPPPAPILAEGYRLLDATGRSPRRPHPLARRNGAQVARRLKQCSLYRPELDLAILTDGQEVAAYCLCWLDSRNHIGLFEPVRTEDAHQGRRLGQALMREGLRRLTGGGATLIKVSYQIGNEAAQRLYESVGFRPAFRKLVLQTG